VTATPNSGYSFVNWTANGSVVITSASYTFTLNGNVTLVANFTPVVSTQYTIAVNASPSADGTVSGGGTFASGSSDTVIATPNSGYSFVNWTANGSVVSTSASYTFTLNGNVTPVANFTPVAPSQYTIAVSASPSADGTVSGGGTFAAGSSDTVTATPNSGYSFVNWTANGSVVSTSASYTFTLNGNVTLVANFTPTTAAYVGFLDTYNSLGATFGLSTKKLFNAYSGYAIQVRRVSDNTTQNIGFRSNGDADPSAFNAFCSGTTCYLSIWYDQVNGNNAVQATAAKQWQVFVDTDGLLTLQPGPGTTMTVADAAVYKTPQVELFATARPNYLDNRIPEPNPAAVVGITGTVTNGSPTITAMSSQAGITTASPPGGNSGATVEGAGIPSLTQIGAFPSGSSSTMTNNATGGTSGEALTFINPVFDGAWIIYGPSGTTYWSNAYWGFGTDFTDSVEVPRNGQTSGFQSVIQDIYGQGQRNLWGIWDFDTYTLSVYVNGVKIGQQSNTNANVTYSTAVGLTIGSDASGSEVSINQSFRQMVLFPATESARVAMAQEEMGRWNVSTLPTSSTTADGFTWTPEYIPGFSHYDGPDVYGMTWWHEFGGYSWPSVELASNINNSTTMARFTVEVGDSDTIVTGAERSERGGGLGSNATKTFVPGGNFSIFYQFEIEQMATQNGSWCYTMQNHYGNGGLAPDLIAISCSGGKLQFVTQHGSGPTTVNQGSAQTLTVGTTYAVVINAHWATTSASNADTLQIWFGPNGSALTEIVNVGPTMLWDTVAAGGYVKQGIYRGYPNQNAGTDILRVMNHQLSLTANAYSAYITSQPQLPTHP
jgi:Divergent InlB B-repeat domain/Alpha-L-arabinofuranosidase B, catalytic